MKIPFDPIFKDIHGSVENDRNVLNSIDDLNRRLSNTPISVMIFTDDCVFKIDFSQGNATVDFCKQVKKVHRVLNFCLASV